MMRDTLPGIGNYDYPFKQIPFTTEGTVRYDLGDSGDGLGAIFAAV
jgi:hypothetical protein